jgi:hypothetical protein
MSLNSILTQIKDAEIAKRKALATLHVELGYASAQALAEAILEANGGPSKAKSNTPTTNGAPKAQKRGRRIDPQIKAQVLAALKSGQPGARVAKQFGISYPTLHNWKSEAGMVKARGKGGKRGK